MGITEDENFDWEKGDVEPLIKPTENLVSKINDIIQIDGF